MTNASHSDQLVAVNQELRSRVAELEAEAEIAAAMLRASDVHILWLDGEFRIQSFTPAMTTLLNILPSDKGRPISDLSLSPLGHHLLDDARSVQSSQVPRSKEYRTASGAYYLRRILPHLTDQKEIHGVMITFADISEVKRSLESSLRAKELLAQRLTMEVEACSSQLHVLMQEVTIVEERERRTLAQDLHDNCSQLLAILLIKLCSIEQNERRGHLRHAIGEIRDLVGQVDHALRSLSFQMWPVTLCEVGLVPAIKWLAEEMAGQYGLSVAIDDDGQVKSLQQPVRIVLFRAVRELLINVAKHAETSVADVVIRRQEQKIRIETSDRGVGFDPRNLAKGHRFGLCCLKDRLAFIGGTLQIQSKPGEGTLVVLTAPLANEASSGDPLP